MGEGRPTLSVSELYEQWRADNAILDETPGGNIADSAIVGRVIECERDMGRTPARTLGEIILKARIIQAWKGIRPDHLQAIADSLVADLDTLYTFGGDADLPEPNGG